MHQLNITVIMINIIKDVDYKSMSSMTIILHISKNDGYCHFCEYSPGSQFSLS